VNSPCCGNLVPIQLAMNKNSAVSSLLIQYGADVHLLRTISLDDKLFTSQSPLMVAILRKNVHLGRLLLEGMDRVRLFGEEKQVLARIEKVNGMSAHGDRNELLKWLDGMQKKPRKVFVIHGEERATEAFAEYINMKLGLDSHVAKYRETIELD